MDNTAKKSVRPSSITVEECLQGGAVVTAEFRYHCLFRQAFSEVSVARETAKKLVDRKFTVADGSDEEIPM